MNEQINIGFIGYGNMAQAIAKGLIGAKVCASGQIFACAGHYDKLCKNAEELGINAVKTAKELVGKVDFVILAVKPHQIESVTRPVVNELEHKVVISIAAGYTFEDYERLLNPGTHHISTIPNTPVSVGEGILVCEEKHSLSQEEFNLFKKLFSKIALVELVDSSQLSIAGTVSGCAPAYTAMYLEALADAGVKHGLARKTAYRLAAKMITGTGRLYLENETHPGIMKDAICSPGGTTIKGVASLEESGFRGAVIKAIDTVEGEQ